MSELVSKEQLAVAQRVIAGKVHRTSLLSSEQLNRQFGIRLFFKPELFQKTGAFKVRGVLNKLHHMPAAEREKGVVTISAGNHAQALAWASAQYGIDATVVMPATAVESKVRATQGYGGTVILTEDDLMDTCLTIQKERDLTLVHPFDDPYVIAGQGTVGVEIMEDLPDVDLVLTGIGGGGMISGISAAVKAYSETAQVIGVEPVDSCAMKQSVERGEPVKISVNRTVADGLAAPFAGVHTLAHVQAFVDEIVLVSDDEIVESMKTIMEWCKVVPEPAAAASFAAILSGKIALKPDSNVVCVLSGGNVDRHRLKDLW